MALGDLNLIRESLQDGVLVAPFDLVLDQGISYFLVYPPHRGHLPKIRAPARLAGRRGARSGTGAVRGRLCRSSRRSR
ncbi:MAG: hypothetical protein WDN69_27670 [Aliidongia sp.]